MITKRVMAFEHSGASGGQLEAGRGRFRVDRMLGLALTGLIVATIGIAGQAQSAEAAADLSRSKQLAIAEVGGQVGIGATGLDVTALRGAAAARSATEALRGAQPLVAEAGAELGAAGVAGLVSLSTAVIAQLGAGSSAAAVVTTAAELRAEQGAVGAALAAHRQAVAAQLAAEAAAAQAAADAAAQQVADEGDDWSGGSDAAASASGEATGEAAAAAPAANPYTSEFYPGLPAAPRDEDCGPCTGKEMVPVYYNGKYVWGCDA
ncbi:hypothetical protein [Agromyces sp. Root1464]|uniref:hypothetical protein n=1 Tax=Agromyces sp. Root1464 TaxID=1736467 RepID=UPI000AA22DB4|nr:hypothetical protein [Agromyces sp. Root1464]